MSEEVLFTFLSTRTAIKAERILLTAGLDAKVMPMPEALSAQCGIVLRLPPQQLETANAALQAADVPIDTIYQKIGDEITPYA
ncbi:MAG: DUF3343 domain-containing protein [Oscillospiraceae bacterium]|nr:DUF3343 domain-containing protein [Oscillospiraceae bacterium]